MKKFLNITYVLLGVMVILNSCHREDFPSHQIPTESDCPIEFSPISASLETKADASATIEGFKVWASNKVNNVDNYNVFGSEGTDVEKSGNIWDYSPVRYWQSSDYSFYAVSPIEISTSIPISGTLANTGLSIHFGEKVDGSYTGWDLSANQTDLLLASAQDVKTRLNATNTPVPLAFDHLLSKISFSARNMTETPLKITNIKISGHHKIAESLELSGTEYDWEFKDDGSTNKEIQPSSVFELSSSSNRVTADILVFPENCDLTIEVTISHIASNDVYSKTAKIESTGWLSGKQYDYIINVSPRRVFITSNQVKDWVTDLNGNSKNDDNIDHDFE